MEGNCPKCRVRLELPASGVYQCERCKSRFEVALGSPHPPAPPAPALGAAWPAWGGPAGAPGGPPPAMPLEGGRLCTTHVEGRAYCPKCFDLLYSRGALGFAQRQFTAPGITLALGLAALFLLCLCFPLSIPVGVGGLVTGARALREHRARPELPNRGLTVGGMALSGISIVGSVIIIGVIVWFSMNR
ncbi:MAG: hypothetical protein K0Q72_3351 [Armatimonadetes bacterium]|nr:hypothetical protein [Armatimonadota bacterium]